MYHLNSCELIWICKELMQILIDKVFVYNEAPTDARFSKPYLNQHY